MKMPEVICVNPKKKYFWLKELIKVLYGEFDPCWNLQKCPPIVLLIGSLRYYLLLWSLLKCPEVSGYCTAIFEAINFL